MKIMSLASIINAAFNYVVYTSKKFDIDESHSLKHSMEVFHLANKIYDSELPANEFLKKHQNIISISAILHDMCDKKYMNEQSGIQDMQLFMKDYMKESELEIVSKIISTMSYSKVNQKGFPDLKEYQLAYHIVREADLLSAYDIDRCIIYGMMKEKKTYNEAIIRALELCDNRILKYRCDNLFITEYSKNYSERLHNQCLEDIKSIKIRCEYNIKKP
jgi:HD superfamily phosphodiesterase